MILATTLAQTADFFIKGGPFMVLLIILSITSLTIILLRGRALRAGVVVPRAIVDAVEDLASGGNLDVLERTIHDHPSATGRILTTLIQHLGWSKAENLEAVQTRARHEFTRLEKGLVILEIATGTGPLLGLLGTLSGLVGIFTALGGNGDPVVVARGISEALNATIVGLAVAVPSLIAYSYYLRKIEMMAVEIESLAADLMVKCYPQGESYTGGSQRT